MLNIKLKIKRFEILENALCIVFIDFLITNTNKLIAVNQTCHGEINLSSPHEDILEKKYNIKVNKNETNTIFYSKNEKVRLKVKSS